MNSCEESAPGPHFASSAAAADRSLQPQAFGRSFEKLGQIRLELGDLETDFAASVPDIELPTVADTDKVRVLPVRKLKPNRNLPRRRVVRERSCACCPGCGGDLRAMGEDSDKVLNLLAQALAGDGDHLICL
ncbi:hypothetical protein RFM41_33535 [Mesorhizobium sp. VK25A]|uniref:Uncharacterized protein n=1 Tax=Mesorhizobium vachelliae TaxID=3072309 RepID=A0ABU5AF70_9HYPH|nr:MULTISPECIES: hypothetical protein [unclassified Mesorhizobium]MDX8535903.1 hypothetical protein [Mesorhizobium sp. VK25D]MDX8548657.1 hypothetical protein [Mesorhizobium sp. VK25A]